MRKLLFVAFILINTFSFAQNNAKTPSAFKRIYVGLSTTHGLSYRYLGFTKESKGSPFTEMRISLMNQNSTYKYSYDAGIRLGVNILRNFSFETGLQYSYKGYTETMENVEMELQTDLGNYIFWGTQKHKYNFYYLDIPLQLNYYIGKKKCRGAIAAGFNINVLIKQSYIVDIISDFYSTQRKSDNKQNYQAANISPFLGVGIDYAITSFMNLRIMPLFQIQALRNNKDVYSYYNTEDGIANKLYSGGINVALNFGFVDAGAAKSKE